MKHPLRSGPVVGIAVVMFASIMFVMFVILTAIVVGTTVGK